jgi:hypothetical protein
MAYCHEYIRHGDDLDDMYRDLLFKYISRDGVKAVPKIVEIIDDFDPTRNGGKKRDAGEQYDAASMLLSDIDGTVVRLRASDEGRSGIDAMIRSTKRMQATHYDNAEGYEYSKQGRYRLTLGATKEMLGINALDEAVRQTLRLKYKISLSESQMLDFVNYMISQDPKYPRWSETTLYKDLEQRNEAGYPLQYHIVKNVEPFYRLYLQYKSKTK